MQFFDDSVLIIVESVDGAAGDLKQLIREDRCGLGDYFVLLDADEQILLELRVLGKRVFRERDLDVVQSSRGDVEIVLAA